MKVGLHNRVDWITLHKIEEIIFPWTERSAIYDLADNFADKTFILKIPHSLELSYDDEFWNELTELSGATHSPLIFAVEDFKLIIKDLPEHGYTKFYYDFPITNYNDLRILEQINVCYVKLGAPLFFEMPRFTTTIPIRAVVNAGHSGTDFLEPTGLYGTWIRPEDLDLYEPYLAAIEFEVSHREPIREQTLYHIYYEDKAWPGPLADIIEHFTYSCMNPMLLDIGKRRLNCGLICRKTQRCNFCKNTIKLAEPTMVENYLKDQQKEEMDDELEH